MRQEKNISHNLFNLLCLLYDVVNQFVLNCKDYISHSSSRIYLVALLLTVSSCEQSFQPLENNEEFFFSMYGFIDASVDTQWVRITPIRKQVDVLADGSEIIVTIENVNSDTQIIMKDSLFQLDRNFLNFWTNQPIEHNQTYRLTAELTNGEKSEVIVITPEEMPLPKIAEQTSPDPSEPPEYFVLVDSSVNLADIQTKYYVRLLASNLDVKRTYSFSYRNSAEITDAFPGFYSVQIKPEEEIEEIGRQVLLPPDGEIEVVYRQVYVAVSGMEWNEEIELLDDVTYTLPHTLRNVENGLGYVIGIDSKYIPYAGCTDPDGNIISCGAEQPYW